MFTIESNSAAGRDLRRIMEDKETYKVSIDYRPTARGGQFVAIKQNERMWSPSLSCTND